MLPTPITLSTTRFDLGVHDRHWSSLSPQNTRTYDMLIDQVENKSRRQLQNIASNKNRQRFILRSRLQIGSIALRFLISQRRKQHTQVARDGTSVLPVRQMRYLWDTQRTRPLNKLHTGIHCYEYNPTCTYSRTARSGQVDTGHYVVISCTTLTGELQQ